MAEASILGFAAPIDPADPCGPDLDLAGDPDFLNYLARAEGLLPAQFFSPVDGKPFDRNAIDTVAEAHTARGLLARTRDIRLLVLLAKFSILDRKLAEFSRYVQVIAKLLNEQWEHVNPCPEGADFGLRIVVLQSLDDTAPVVLPLQHTPIARHPRHGPVSFRQHLVASGQLIAREDEPQLDATTIDRIGMEADLGELIEARDDLQAIKTALAQIRAICVERLGFEHSVRLDRLPLLVDQMVAFLDRFVLRRDPSAALAPAPPSSETADQQTRPGELGGKITTLPHAKAALKAACDYFSRLEPSNPALLLVRQAEELVGKSFIDVLRVLVPAYVDQAAVGIGRTETFDLSLGRLSELATVDGPPPEPDEMPLITIETRQDALTALKDTAAFFSSAEPASPIPYLLERAVGLATRDFLSILKDILPENTLKVPGQTQ